MATKARQRVNIYLISGTENHALATNFPLPILSRVSARFATDLDNDKSPAVKRISNRRFDWTIYDPAATLSTKAFKIVFIWLCSVLSSNAGKKPSTRITISGTGEAWGLVGVVAVRQICRCLRLRGEFADQEHLTEYVLNFLEAKWRFVWDDIVLSWIYMRGATTLKRALVDSVFAYVNDAVRAVSSFLDNVVGFGRASTNAVTNRIGAQRRSTRLSWRLSTATTGVLTI